MADTDHNTSNIVAEDNNDEEPPVPKGIQQFPKQPKTEPEFAQVAASMAATRQARELGLDKEDDNDGKDGEEGDDVEPLQPGEKRHRHRKRKYRSKIAEEDKADCHCIVM